MEIGAGKVRVSKEDQILRRSSVGRVGKRGNCEGGLGVRGGRGGIFGWEMDMGVGEREGCEVLDVEQGNDGLGEGGVGILSSDWSLSMRYVT